MAPREREVGRGNTVNTSGSTISAAFKVDPTSLDALNAKFKALVRHATAFNTQLKEIGENGKALDRLCAGMSGGVPGQRGSGSMITASPMTTPAGSLFSGSAAGGPAGNTPTQQRAAKAGLVNGGGGTFPASGGQGGGGGITPGKAAFWTGMTVAGGAAAYGLSQRENWVESERLAQLTMWGTNGGKANQVMDQARHSWFGGAGQTGMSGYTSQPDAFAGLNIIRERQGLNQSARSREMTQAAGRAGNVLGSLEQGAQASTSFYSPQNYYKMLGMGISTLGPGGKRTSQEDIADQLLSRTFGGKGWTSEMINEGRAEGAPLRATLDSLGMTPEQKEYILSYGEIKGRMGAGTTPSQVRDAFIKTGSNDTDKLGDTVYDSDRRNAQDKAQLSQELADKALPQLRKQVDATAAAFRGLNNALDSTGLMGPAGTGLAVASPIMSAVNGASGFAGGMGLFAAMNAWQNRGGRGGGGGPRPGPGGGGALAGASRLLGPAALAAGGLVVGGSVARGSDNPWGKVGGRATQGAAIGAGLGMLGGPFGAVTVPGGALIGGLAGGVMGAFEGFGGPGNYGSAEEVDVLASISSSPGGGPGSGVVPSGQDSDAPDSASPGQGGTSSDGATSGAATSRGAKAIAWMQRQSKSPTTSWKNLCLRATRLSLGVGAGAGSASEGWGRTEQRHGGTPPPGVPVWWTGGQYGHVALSAGGGMVWSNDILRDGKIDKVPISMITKRWGKTYRGWSEDVNGVDVYDAAAIIDGAPAAAAAGKGSKGGGGNAGTVARFLRGKGMSPAQVAGILGNLQQESGMNPGTQQRNGPAYGLVQWEGSRLTALKAYAAKNNGSLSSMGTQLDFLWSELTGPESGGYKRFLAQSETPAAAAMSWSKYIERPGTPHMSNRVKYANQFAIKGYEKGAYEIQGDQLALVHHGEMVVPAPAARQVRDYVKRNREGVGGRGGSASMGQMSGGRAPLQVTLNMPVHVTSGGGAADATKLVQAVARAMESDARLAAVMGGD